MTQTVRLSLADVHEFATRVLVANGMEKMQADALANVMAVAQRDECHSHGLYRLIMCVKTLRAGKVVPNAVPVVEDVSPALVKVDACRGFSQPAFEVGSKALIEKARTVGVAALAINNCFHFSALWPEVEVFANEGLAAIAMTPSHSWVAPAGGTKPVLGTNPMAFAWPRPGPTPFVFDFATSAAARGDFELYRRAGKKIPLDWGYDAEGNPTDDPAAALGGAMRTFGGHKGSALSVMIELLAGPLVGDLMSMESQAFDRTDGAAPFHGEIILAFNPAMFGGLDWRLHADRAEKLFEGIIDAGARLPSQRRFEARQRSIDNNGVEIPEALYKDLLALIPA
jgi:LDH2 family malate/lactate/ureidoglycolate dehydrogenase